MEPSGASRRMVRSFADRPVDPKLVDALLDDSLVAPTAGNTRGTAWVVLQGVEETTHYWEQATTEGWRNRARRWPGLSKAPVLALSLTSPDAYLARYREPDKVVSTLGASEAAWPVPYWFGDAAFATMVLLQRAREAGLGACFLGNFREEAAVLAAFGVPTGWRWFGTVALGHPDGQDPPSSSLSRPGPPPASRVHRGRW